MLNQKLRNRACGIAAITFVSIPLPSFSEVVHLDKEIEVGDQLYTRAASDDCKKVKIWKKTIEAKSDDGHLIYTLELAVIQDLKADLDPVVFEKIGTRKLDDLCKKGGCYTALDEPVADAKRWLSTNCEFRKN